jgi:molybdenum cofactor cytidylyltransferase
MKTNVHCLLLCAGQSVRMRPHHKLFLPVQKSSVIEHVLEQIIGANFASMTVVTGFESQRIETLLKPFSIQSVHNPDFASGMHSSIRTGLRSLSTQEGFVAVCLADQPHLETKHYETLIEKASAHSNAMLVCPGFEGQRGNPVLINLKLRDFILSQPDHDRGCSYLFELYPNDVISVPMSDHSTLLDLDTPEDYQCLLTSTNL